MIRISTFLLSILLLAACNSSNSTEESATETAVDSAEVVTEKETLKNPKDLVEEKNTSSLNNAQKQVQSLLQSCVDKDYESAAKTIMYLGNDESRLGNDHFNVQNTKEAGTVKVTCEVLREWLGESENYEFVSFMSDTTDAGIEHKVEVLFKKEDLGMQRHFFYYKETDKGLLLFNMI